jgi:RNA polymerase sigma factor (sigma-70 family)
MRHAVRLTGSTEMAADAVQDAWIAIFRGIRRLGDPSRFGAWSYRIVTNKCVDLIRHRQRTRMEVGYEDVADEGLDSEDEKVDSLRRAIRRLPGEKRALLGLVYQEGMSLRAVAESLGLAVGTVKSRLFNLRAELRGLMKGEDDD